MRRAAAKTLSALVSEYPQLLDSTYPAASQALLARFREREEAVKLDAFTTLVDLIHQVAPATGYKHRAVACVCPLNRILFHPSHLQLFFVSA